MQATADPTPRVRAVETRDVARLDALAVRCGLSVDAAAELERAQSLFILLTEDEDGELDVVPTDAGGLLGFALGWVVADELEILDVAVDVAARGRGHGATLLRELTMRAVERGARQAFLEVRATNQAAIRLYERAGFSRVGERRGYYADGEDAWLFGRALD